jgi:hypothetical protein
MIKASRSKIEQKIIETKTEGGKVEIFGLKPLTDLPTIIKNVNSVLDGNDSFNVYGSYNIRLVEQNASELNDILNGNYKTKIFESFFALEKNNFPKEIMRTEGSEYSVQVNEIHDLMMNDSSPIGVMQNSSINVWNRAVSYDCIFDSIGKTLIKEGTGTIQEANLQKLKDYANNLGAKVFDTANPLTNIVNEFTKLINDCLFDEREVLTGKERFEKDYNEEFATRFKNELSSFNWNWKVLQVIGQDPTESLIGDYGVYLASEHPELFVTLKTKVTCAAGKYTTFTEDNSSNTEQVIGVNNFTSFLNTLKSVFPENNVAMDHNHIVDDATVVGASSFADVG